MHESLKINKEMCMEKLFPFFFYFVAFQKLCFLEEISLDHVHNKKLQKKKKREGKKAKKTTHEISLISCLSLLSTSQEL